jgi:hypothetical protein
MPLQTEDGASVTGALVGSKVGNALGAEVVGAELGADVVGAELGADVAGAELGTAVKGAELGVAVDGSGLGAAEEVGLAVDGLGLGALLGGIVRQVHTPLSETGSESQITFGISPFKPNSRSSAHVVSGPPETGTTSAPLLHKLQTGYGPPCAGVIIIINMMRKRLMFQSRRMGRFDFNVTVRIIMRGSKFGGQ